MPPTHKASIRRNFKKGTITVRIDTRYDNDDEAQAAYDAAVTNRRAAKTTTK